MTGRFSATGQNFSTYGHNILCQPFFSRNKIAISRCKIAIEIFQMALYSIGSMNSTGAVILK